VSTALANLFLDDVRDSPYGERGCVARTATDALRAVLALNLDWVEWSLDHDLGVGPTGYDFLCAAEELYRRGFINLPLRIIVHSSNPVGRENMQSAIDRLYEHGGEE